MRLFREHTIRPVCDLGGRWDFVTEPELATTDEAGLPTAFVRPMQVPGCWESHPEYRAYRGRAWLRRTIRQPAAGPLRLVFKGVSHTGRVYLDREKVGEHYNAYTAFEVAMAEVEAGEHELLVEVDNAFGDHSALHVPNDYYTYGGITRPVAAERVPPQYVRFLHVTPQAEADGGWSAAIRVEVVNLALDDAEVRAEVELAGRTVDLGKAALEPGATVRLEAEAAFPEAQSWSPAAPQLYTARALLYSGGDEPTDDLIDRVGFRRVEVRGTDILLNGSPVRIRGFNRHEDHPHFGCALPVEAMVHDMERLRHLGANLDRTCHYPNDERWLDLCDERGILVWEENHARGLKLERMRTSTFRRQSRECTREMVEQHFNHPSIILWGIFNECASNTEEGKAVYAEEFELLRRLDPSRPTTFASCHRNTELAFDLPDVVGFNIYTGWYHDSVEKVREKIDGLIDWIESAGGRDKPILISEFGAGGLYGCRSDHHAPWSEEYQADVLDAACACYLSHPRLAGGIVWQFCDCRVSYPLPTGRPRRMNNKGVVDEHRRPKLAYEAVRRRFHEAAAEERKTR